MTAPGRLGILALAVLLAASACRLGGPAAKSGVGVTPVKAATPTQDVVGVIHRANFRITYVLSATLENGILVQLVSNPLLLLVPSISPNTTVMRGTVIGTTIIDPTMTAQMSSATNTVAQSELVQLQSLLGPVVAPMGGIFTDSSGTPAIESPGVDLVAGLLPVQYLRYQAVQFAGTSSIETTIGQQDVSCAAVWVEPAAGSSSNPNGSQDPYEVHCRLPPFVQTAAGLTAQLTLTSQMLNDVIVVPTVDIGYHSDSGYYLRVWDGGHVTTLPVTVGVTNGVLTVVTSQVPLGASLAAP